MMRESILRSINSPFLKILPPFITGIIVEARLYLHEVPILICIGLCISGLLAFGQTRLSFQFKWNMARSMLIHLLLFTSGLWVTWMHTLTIHRQWVGSHFEAAEWFVMRVAEPWSIKNGTCRTQAEMICVYHHQSLKPAEGRIWVYHASSKPGLLPAPGTRLLLRKKPEPVRGSGNPGAFDFGSYSARSGIYHQVYLKAGDYHLLPHKQKFDFRLWAYVIRDRLIAILQKYIPGETERGLAEALLLGYRDHLDQELLDSYSQTGVIHLIAVSGLHLGLIYWILALFMKPFSRLKSYRLLKLLLIIPLLWLFWLVTGATASVTRSALMFTCIVIGNFLEKRNQLFNNLACSAFLLLVFDPYQLWNPGCQLSYAAVVSIASLTRLIENWFAFENPVAAGAWKLVSVTLAAQVFTFPLVLYHFHQYSILFLFANMLAVPLSTLILFAEILLCMLSLLALPAGFLGRGISVAIHTLNDYIERLSQVPFASGEGIPFNLFQLCLLYGTLICTLTWLNERKKMFLLLALIQLTVLGLVRFYVLYKIQHQQKIIIYNLRKASMVDLIKGNSAITIREVIPGNAYKYMVGEREKYRLAMGVCTVRRDSMSYPGGHFISAGSLRIIVIDSHFRFPAGNPKQRLKADLLLLTGNPAIQISELNNQFLSRVLVADPTNDLWKIRQWKKDAERLHLRFHSVPETGAFQWDPAPP